jgi:Na+/proline symporter/nitrogen-specific signal transduction histidine kinase
MSKLLIISVIIGYLVMLFLIANFAERLKKKNKSILPPSLTYALSIAVFCTAWTFFGSIGNAAKTGIGFLPVYLGPTLYMPLIGLVLVKIIRICKAQRITSIADFISSRYGKNISLGVLVSLFSIIGIIPYIAIQLKAISASVNLLTQYSNLQDSIFTDSTFYISIGLVFFIIIYGIRNVDTTERHTGVVSAIAFEAIVKLVAFIAVGIFVCYYLFNGITDIFTQASSIEQLKNHFIFNEQMNPMSWFLISIVSALALILLPRQFQVSIVENTDITHVKKAMWMFPLYLLIINLFVLPIALAGILTFPNGIDYDMLLLHFPNHNGHTLLTLFVFVGGFSAATGMVIVEVIALTTMISNNITVPLLLSSKLFKHNPFSISKTILMSRRIGVIILISLAFIFEKVVAENYSLVSIGMISFVAVAQFSPSVLLGIYWKAANRKASLASILIGFSIWFYTLVLPSLSNSSQYIHSIVQDGPFHLSILKPTSLFGMQSLDTISHGIFWSLLINTIIFIIISFQTKASIEEEHQALLFVDTDNQDAPFKQGIWKGITLLKDIKNVLSNFIGQERTSLLLEGYANRHSIILDKEKEADTRIVNFAEQILGGVIGSASSRLMISSVTKDEKVSLDEVIDIVKESQQFIELNKELRKKSIELEKASNELSKANTQLKQMDELKNEFLYTVTHELRTPLTSIRALSEIVYDNPDLDDEQKQDYLDIIIKETEKLSHLITQVLNLEKYESGKQKIYPSSFDIKQLSKDVIKSLTGLSEERKLNINFICQDSSMIIHADKDLINQVIYNLVSNAIKFAETTIDIYILPSIDDIEIKIKDDGPGINESTKDLLFDKFYQSKQSHLQKPVGSGLGLAICKKIIELHHGKISVENNQGKGASFTFALPIIH